MLAAILATALAANGTPDWPQRINLEPSRGLLASRASPGAPTPREALCVPRIAAEMLAGGASAAILGAAGVVTGILFFADSIYTMGTPALVGGSIGASVGAYMGVLFSGLILQGGGSLGWTLAGDLAGLTLALLTSSALGAVAFVAFPVLGAMLAFEMSGAMNSAAMADRRDAAGADPLFGPVVARF